MIDKVTAEYLKLDTSLIDMDFIKKNGNFKKIINDVSYNNLGPYRLVIILNDQYDKKLERY